MPITYVYMSKYIMFILSNMIGLKLKLNYVIPIGRELLFFKFLKQSIDSPENDYHRPLEFAFKIST